MNLNLDDVVKYFPSGAIGRICKFQGVYCWVRFPDPVGCILVDSRELVISNDYAPECDGCGK